MPTVSIVFTLYSDRALLIQPSVGFSHRLKRQLSWVSIQGFNHVLDFVKKIIRILDQCLLKTFIGIKSFLFRHFRRGKKFNLNFYWIILKCNILKPSKNIQ